MDSAGERWTLSLSSSSSEFDRGDQADGRLFTRAIGKGVEENARPSQTIDECRLRSYSNSFQEWSTYSCTEEFREHDHECSWEQAIESVVLLRDERMALSLSMRNRFFGIECPNIEDRLDSLWFSEESHRRGLVPSRIETRGQRIGNSQQQQNHHHTTGSSRPNATRRQSIIRWNADLHQNIDRQNHHHWRKSSKRRDSRLHSIIVSRSRLRIRLMRSNRRSKIRKEFLPISNGWSSPGNNWKTVAPWPITTFRKVCSTLLLFHHSASLGIFSLESTLHLVLRLRGGPPPDPSSNEGKRKRATINSNVVGDDDGDYESIDAGQMSGLSEHVVYSIDTPVSIRSHESALVTINKWHMDAQLVLYYDPKINDLNAIKAVHLRNNSGIVLAPGSIAVLDDGRFVAQCAFTPMLPNDDQLIK